MSGFFSLGGAFGISKEDNEEQQHDQNQNQEQQEDSIITPNSLYLFKNEEIYSKGFELWQQYYQLHQHRQHQHQHHQPPPHYDSGVSGRRKSFTGCVDDLCLNSSSNHNNNNSNNNNNLYASPWNFITRSAGSSEGTKVMRQAGYVIGGGDHGGGGSGSGSGGGINCQDCGNQAKKDCHHMRCRTCCKSRGFQCQTHVKSTWVPAAKRRERQQQLTSLTQQQQQQQQEQNLGNQQLSLMMRGGGSGGAGGNIDQNPKRLREDHQLIATAGGGGAVALNLPSTQHHNTSSGLEIGHFPAELSSPAVFRCVRVSAMDEAEEQLAYQTAVNIGGHVFKGILYDHGPEGRYNHPGGGDSSGGTGNQHQQLNLITSGTMGVATVTTTVNPNVTSIDPSSIYPTPLNAFMAGTQFFPPPRS